MTATPSQTSSTPGEQAPPGPRVGPVGIALWVIAGVFLVAAGLVLWHARGAGVFTDVLAAAIAWCF